MGTSKKLGPKKAVELFRLLRIKQEVYQVGTRMLWENCIIYEEECQQKSDRC